MGFARLSPQADKDPSPEGAPCGAFVGLSPFSGAPWELWRVFLSSVGAPCVMRRSKFEATAALARDLISAAVVNTLDAPVPTEPGAYLLIMEMSDPVPLEIRALGTAALPAGRYAYAGSAWGPGGIRARIIRHLKVDKKRHWHIDHLTAVAPPIEVIAFPGRNECDILAEILARPGASIPVSGFGSSDCRDCPAHLVQLA